MTLTDRGSDTASNRQPSDAVSRRRFLGRAGAAGLALAGVGAGAVGSAAAHSSSVEMIDLDRGLRGWLGGEPWKADGSLPVVDECFVYVHGYLGNLNAEDQTRQVLNSVEAGGFDPDAAVGVSWPATRLNYFGAESDTEHVGATIADLVEAFYDDGGGNVRLIGHSLGGRSVYWTVTKLERGYALDTVAGLGAAAHGDEICDTWDVAAACEVRNYHSHEDGIVSVAYGDDALGVAGADCATGSNYTDVDVSDSVDSHLDHLGNAAVGADIAAAITDGDC